MTSQLDAALAYLAQGWSVFPCRDKHTPLVKWKKFQRERPTAEEVQEWWSSHPDAYIGVALGQPSGIVRIDADSEQAYDELLKLGGLPDTLSFVTPSGGRGWLLRHIEGVTTNVLWKGKGEHQELRLQSDGAYTILPPSPGYSWTSDKLVAAIPKWLYQWAVEQAVKSLERELAPTVADPDKDVVLEAVKHLSPERADDYTSWIRVGIALHSGGDEYFEVWKEWSRQSSKFKDGECEKLWAGFNRTGRCTVRSILWWARQDGWEAPRLYEPLTDVGNGRVLARMCEGRALWCRTWEKWVAWDGRRWAVNDEFAVVAIAKQAIRDRYHRAVDSLKKLKHAEGDDTKKKLKSIGRVLSWCKHSESAKAIHAAVDMSRSEPGMILEHWRLDTRDDLFNCPNGTLELSTGDLREHRPEDMMTQLCPTDFSESAPCPLWERFVQDVLPDAEVRLFLQQFLGSCLSGDTSVQVLPVFWGSGANGKSTLVEAVFAVLGVDYAMKAKRDLLMSKRSEAHPTSLARLHGKRFVGCVETSEDGRLDEALVKEITGSDTIAARRMREDEWEFRPTHKAILATNHKPEIRGTDDGIWRRIQLVPFAQKFDADRADPQMLAKLKQEAPGILRWMYDGYKLWREHGYKLTKPAVVEEATKTYRSEQDWIGQFLESRCTVEPEAKVRTEELTRAYLEWCSQNNVRAATASAMGRAFSSKGFFPDPSRKYRIGLRLK